MSKQNNKEENADVSFENNQEFREQHIYDANFGRRFVQIGFWRFGFVNMLLGHDLFTRVWEDVLT